MPERSYPAGYEVECSGCAYERSSGRLSITAAPGPADGGGPATILVRPAR